jgi:hypothetical protein
VSSASLIESRFECVVVHPTVDRSKAIHEMVTLLGVLPAFADALKLQVGETLKQEIPMFQCGVEAS